MLLALIVTSTVIYFIDPLEQFEVLSFLPYGTLNNLGAVLILNVILMTILFASYNINVTNNYDFALRAIYQLVRSIVKENLYIRKQQYFTVLFYLFITLLLANLIGLIPFSFTVTSSFVFTFFVSLIHFSGVNLIGASRHQ